MEVSKEIEKYITDELVDGNDDAIGLDVDLLSQGIIDSIGVIKLVAFMEERFGIKVSDVEIVPDYFRDIKSLTKLVEGKLNS